MVCLPLICVCMQKSDNGANAPKVVQCTVFSTFIQQRPYGCIAAVLSTAFTPDTWKPVTCVLEPEVGTLGHSCSWCS